MGSDNLLLTFLQNFIEFCQGTTGKTVFLVVIIIFGIGMWFKLVNKSWGFGIIGGAVFVFSATYIGQHFFGISA